MLLTPAHGEIMPLIQAHRRLLTLIPALERWRQEYNMFHIDKIPLAPIHLRFHRRKNSGGWMLCFSDLQATFMCPNTNKT